MLEYVNDKSYSGLLTSIFGGPTKKDSLTFSVAVAEQMYETFGNRFQPDTTIKTVAGVRPREVTDDKFYEYIRCRSAIQEEAPVSQLKQIYFRRITKFYKAYNDRWRSEIGLGGQLIGSSVNYFYERFYSPKLKYVVTMDASRHDQNVCEKLLVGAFSILRSMFPRCGRIDRHFFFFASGHIHKRLLMEDGFVYLVSEGIQTGDPATSLINTFVMLLEKAILYKKLGIKQPVDKCYYGDDQIEVFLDNPNFPLDFAEQSKHLIGIKQSDVIIKDMSEGFTYNLKKEPNFLQIYFNNGVPLRSYERVFDKLKYIDVKLRCKPFDKVDAVLSMCFTTYGDFDIIRLCADYANFLISKYNLHLKDAYLTLITKMLKVNVGNINISTLENARGEVGYIRKKRYSIKGYEYIFTKNLMIPSAGTYVNTLLGCEKVKNKKKIILAIKKSGIKTYDFSMVKLAKLKKMFNL